MLSDNKKAILESAMSDQIAILERNIDNRVDNPFTLNRVVNIWKMLKEDPTAWDGSPRMRASDTSPWVPDTEENRRKLGFYGGPLIWMDWPLYRSYVWAPMIFSNEGWYSYVVLPRDASR